MMEEVRGRNQSKKRMIRKTLNILKFITPRKGNIFSKNLIKTMRKAKNVEITDNILMLKARKASKAFKLTEVKNMTQMKDTEKRILRTKKKKPKLTTK